MKLPMLECTVNNMGHTVSESIDVCSNAINN